MAGLDPAIHAANGRRRIRQASFWRNSLRVMSLTIIRGSFAGFGPPNDVDGRVKPGHDGCATSFEHQRRRALSCRKHPAPLFNDHEAWRLA
jgi:hypothetical protein